jgi:general secretion pathway protein G
LCPFVRLFRGREIMMSVNFLRAGVIRFASGSRRWSTARCASLRGFTLLELLVVMVIIGLLAGYVAPKYFSQIGKSEIKVARAQIDALEKALDQYRLDVGHYPSTDQGLGALVTPPANEPKWQGPYLKKGVPPDPWGRAYVYRFPGEHGDFDLYSYGRDGQAGGSGEDADITNW